MAASVWAEAPGRLWVDVPFVHQPREGCGAASIAMVMQYWAGQHAAGQHPTEPAGGVAGAGGNVDVIQHELYSPAEHGIAAERMGAYFREHGFQAFALNGSWSDLEEQLRKGRPLIVALRPRGQRELHYVVVDGIDAERGLVTMNDPAERKLLTRERAGFEREWSATRNWMLLAVPGSVPR